ncbi:hypothetical protein DXG01_011397 [Tephrocybe rancida]|nr:hypothetical protein DXG01_011397 [Tephrocybe rancida]
MQALWLSLLLLQTSRSFAALYNSTEELPTSKYDFIVVGGGTAGNVVANRLTENPEWRVLVVESGPSNEGILETMVPLLQGGLMGSQYDWKYTTTPQQAMDGRNFTYNGGRILGGTSSINLRKKLEILVGRGRVCSNALERLAPFAVACSSNLTVTQTERWTAPVDNHDTNGQFDPSVHGFDGINAVSLAGHPQNIDSRFMQTTKELPDEFPFNLDANSGDPLGVSYVQMSIKKGRRSSSATSYLAPEFLQRANLDVLVNTHVTRVIQTGTSKGLPAFHEVEISHNSAAPRKRLVASKEIVLSAGVIGTTHILLNSGIGDSMELQAVGVKPVLQIHDVGKNFSDHAITHATWLVNSDDTIDDTFADPDRQAQYLQQWETNQTGPLSAGGGSHVIYGRLPDDSPIFQTVPDPASGKNTPHYEIFPYNGGLGLLPSEEGRHFFSLVCVVVSSASRKSRHSVVQTGLPELSDCLGGKITLNTSDPFDYPLIDPGLMTSEYDRFVLRECVKRTIRFVSAPAWKDYIIRPTSGLENVTNDEELNKYVLDTTVPGLHGVGTASMSPRSAKHGVVDPDLRVKGASGLRVADASVMPYVPASHTQAPVYIIAERAADLIKAFWGAQASPLFLFQETHSFRSEL